MPKDTKSLDNNKAPACESRGFVHKKKEGVHFDTPSCGRHDALEVLPSRGAGCAELWNRFFGLLRLEMGLGSGSMPHRWPSPTRGSGLKPWRSLRRWAALFF